MIVKLTKELFNSVKIISISNLFLIKFYECRFSKMSEIKHQLSQNFPNQKSLSQVPRTNNVARQYLKQVNILNVRMGWMLP